MRPLARRSARAVKQFKHAAVPRAQTAIAKRQLQTGALTLPDQIQEAPCLPDVRLPFIEHARSIIDAAVGAGIESDAIDDEAEPLQRDSTFHVHVVKDQENVVAFSMVEVLKLLDMLRVSGDSNCDNFEALMDHVDTVLWWHAIGCAKDYRRRGIMTAMTKINNDLAIEKGAQLVSIEPACPVRRQFMANLFAGQGFKAQPAEIYRPYCEGGNFHFVEPITISMLLWKPRPRQKILGELAQPPNGDEAILASGITLSPG